MARCPSWRLPVIALFLISVVGSLDGVVVPKDLDTRRLDDAGSSELDITVQDGIVIQHKGCPQALSEEEAKAREADSSLPGGILHLGSLDLIGRTGNHFMAISTFLSIGFCCQVKVLTLPGDDNRFPTEDGTHLLPQTRHFSFSSHSSTGETEASSSPGSIASALTAAGYGDLAHRPDVCHANRTIGGRYANQRPRGLFHKDLERCMYSVVVRGCEAEYLRGVVDTCPQYGYDDRVEGEQGAEPGDARRVEADAGEPLAVHIRSGDIFIQSGMWPKYGQPALEFYLKALRSNPWSRVTVVTFARTRKELNPTFSFLEKLSREGALGHTLELYQDREWWKDLQLLLCAENLVLADSTLSFYLLAHTKAKRIFLPTVCGPPAAENRVEKTDQLPQSPLDRKPFNTALICLERPGVEVYGIEWKSTPEAYSPAEKWMNTEAQRMELLVSDEIKALVPCCVQDP